MGNKIINHLLLTIFLIVTRNHTMQQDPQNSNTITNTHQQDTVADKFKICKKARIYRNSKSFRRLSLTIQQENNKIYHVIRLKHFLTKPEMREYIIDELKTDAEALTQLIDKTVAFTLPGTDALYKYRISKKSFRKDNNKFILCLNSKILLDNEKVKNHILNFYKIDQKQTFLERNPKTSLLLVTSYGMLCAATILKLSASQYFLTSSYLEKALQLSTISTSFVLFGAQLMATLVKK